MRFTPCVKHNGRHLDVHGQCVHPGAPYALRPGVCPEAGCRADIMRRLDLSSGRADILEAGSDQPHTHAAPIRVELDPEQLAAAIVSASRAARQERQPQPPQPVAMHPQSPLTYPPSRNGHRDPLGGIPEFAE